MTSGATDGRQSVPSPDEVLQQLSKLEVQAWESLHYRQWVEFGSRVALWERLNLSLPLGKRLPSPFEEIQKLGTK